MQSLEGAWRQITQEFEAAQVRAERSARARVTDELNQLTRRLRNHNAESDWYDALLDGCSRFAAEVALFTLAGDTLSLRGVRGLELPAGLNVPLGDAKAFRSTVDSGEPAVVLCRGDEVSGPIASAVSINRGFVVPITNDNRTVAVLFATSDEDSDTNALELIAQIASSVLRRPAQNPLHVQISGLPEHAGPVERVEAKKNDRGSAAPSWMNLPEPEKLLHARAQRFARTRVAEMQLYRPEACKAGRAESDVYLFLKQEIDAARGTFRSQFMSTTSMIDYLHCELLRQLVDDDETILGADYPGQMA